MKRKSTIITLTFLIFVIFIAGCSQQPEKAADEVKEATPSGILVIKSSPPAQAYIDNEFKGDTPITLYSFPAGPHNVVLKKDGYMDFETAVSIVAGRTQEVEALLTEAEVVKEIEGPILEGVQEEVPEDTPPKLNKISLSKFAMYYDFDKNLFTDLRTEESDVFSRRYDTYVHFTALVGAKVAVIKKPITDVKKDDCVSADATIASIYSRQTLCINTQEGFVVAIGGSWEKIPSELEWVFLD